MGDSLHRRLFDRRDRRTEAGVWSAESAGGMVASAHYLATAAGAEALAAGGNAVDAAVACSLALGVAEPAASGLGGMALALLHVGGRTFTVEGPCRAPAAARPELLRGQRRYRGYRAVAVPGLVRVLQHLLERYGRLHRTDVLASAIRLAERGVPVTAYLRGVVEKYQPVLRNQGGASFLLASDGAPLPVGALVEQPALARTLRRLADVGFDDYYRGAIARAIDADMVAHDGFVRAADLAGLGPPREAEPLHGPLGERAVFTLGPPGGGAALVQLLQMLAAAPAGSLDLGRPADLVRVAAMIRRARLDRRRFARVTDAERMGAAQVMLEPDHARRAMASVEADLAASHGETTHLVTADADGNVVTMTQSIERSFGSAVASSELGFLYNGFLKAFKVRTPDHPHYLRPGAVARSNAAPTIVLAHGRPWAALGCTGSERSVSAIFATLLRLERQHPFEAVAAPRLHCTPEGQVLLEAERFSPDALAALERAGYELHPLEPYAFKVGGLQLVVRAPGGYCGVADPRRDGWASGPRPGAVEQGRSAGPNAVGL